MYTAMKPKYNRKTKSYDVEVLTNADLILVHAGYFVFDDLKQALDMILDGRCLQGWKKDKRDAVVSTIEMQL